MNIEPVDPPNRLRIAVLGDFDGIHTRSWLRWFVARGHDMHAISFYPPAQPLDGVTMHVLRPRPASTAAPTAEKARRSSPGRSAGAVRLAHAFRYRRAGLRRVLDAIAPDIFHAHFVVEHGFYGATAGRHPLVVTAWGSDILVAPERDPVSRLIARWTLGRADLITSNNQHMARRIVQLGALEAKVHVVTLGADAFFAERWHDSVNVRGRDADDAPVILSTRAHEPLYNVGDILDAYAIVVGRVPAARLVMAHSGSLTEELRAKARVLPGQIEFTGTVDAERLRDLMLGAEVFVSVPSSDGTSVALLQAMAAGCFPIVADLESQHEWIDTHKNGLLVAVNAPGPLAEALISALGDSAMRREAAELNRAIVGERGTNETQMANMEGLYLQLPRR